MQLCKGEGSTNTTSARPRCKVISGQRGVRQTESFCQRGSHSLTLVHAEVPALTISYALRRRTTVAWLSLRERIN